MHFQGVCLLPGCRSRSTPWEKVFVEMGGFIFSVFLASWLSFHYNKRRGTLSDLMIKCITGKGQGGCDEEAEDALLSPRRHLFPTGLSTFEL